MLKMAGTSNLSYIGFELIGKYGKYRVIKKIGSGGNGEVYSVDILEASEDLPKVKGYVVKFLVVNLSDDSEVKKRYARFEKEINNVISFQGNISNIIPIYDASIFINGNQEHLWYLMPLAELYIPKRYDILQRLLHMFQLGMCIKQLHALGYAHRDIKPKNLLLFNDVLCLSDFGLVWNIDNNEEHITEVNDRLGPQAIRPPELQPVEKLDSIDYRQSDVYLFAKTIWMVLKCNNCGFPSEYSRANCTVYIDKNELFVDTAEPLHKLMIEATRDNYWERCNIDDCLKYLGEQVRVIKGDVTREELTMWKYEEQVYRNRDTIPADEKIYKEPSAIVQILNDMSGTVGLVFVSEDKDYGFFPLRKSNYLNDELYEIEIKNPYSNGKKIIELAISDISLNCSNQYEIHSKTYQFNGVNIPIFTQIIQALKSPDRRVRLNAIYSIKMTIN